MDDDGGGECDINRSILWMDCSLVCARESDLKIISVCVELRTENAPIPCVNISGVEEDLLYI